MYKPDGYNSVSPYLIVEDARKCLDFIEAVFAAKPIYLAKRDDGTIMHAEVRIDDTVLMLGQAPGGGGAHVHVYVADVDRSFAKAKAAGGTVVQEPVQKEDSDKRGGVTDLTGTTWWLATQLEPRS